MMRAHGFSIDMLVELVRAGPATTKRERMVGYWDTDGAGHRFDSALITAALVEAPPVIQAAAQLLVN
jgi:hypothetical protein